MAGFSTDFLFGKDLEAIFFVIKSDCFDEAPDIVSMSTETSSEILTEELKALSCTEYSKTFMASRGMQSHFSSKHSKKDIFTLLIRGYLTQK